VLKKLDKLTERVYETLTGQILPQYALPGVENAFEEGSKCMELYTQMLEAYERLRTRLGITEEDPDVEIIIGNLMQIEREISHKMFYYGTRFH